VVLEDCVLLNSSSMSNMKKSYRQFLALSEKRIIRISDASTAKL